MAAEWFATAIKLSPKKAELHFQLGQVLEEQHYVQDLYGIKLPVSHLIVLCLASKAISGLDKNLNSSGQGSHRICLPEPISHLPLIKKISQAH